MISFEKTQQIKGSDIGFRIKFKTLPETDPILSSDTNNLITSEISNIITPDLINSTLRILFYSPEEIIKDTRSELLLLSTANSTSNKLYKIVNSSISQDVIGVIKGADSVSWKLGKIYYIINLLPVGATSYIQCNNSSDYFILK